MTMVAAIPVHNYCKRVTTFVSVQWCAYVSVPEPLFFQAMRASILRGYPVTSQATISHPEMICAFLKEALACAVSRAFTGLLSLTNSSPITRPGLSREMILQKCIG